MYMHVYIYVNTYILKIYIYVYVYACICMRAILQNTLTFGITIANFLLKHLVIHQISPESSALRVVSADLTGKIKERQDVLELILKRLAWALRGLCVSFPPLIYMYD